MRRPPSRPPPPARAPPPAPARRQRAGPAGGRAGPPGGGPRETGFEHSPVPHLIVQGDGRLAFANAQARQLFSIGQRDLLRPFSELEVSYSPVELRSLIDSAHSERRPVSAGEVPLQVSGEQRFYDVHVFPMNELDGDVGTSIAFTDITRYKHMQLRAETAQT